MSLSTKETSPAVPGAHLASDPGTSRPAILHRIVCPHCWHRFEVESILWVSQHAELVGDPILGPDASSRFLPTRFTLEGDALDARGMRSQTMACPRCHLVIPRAWIETEPLFVS